MAFTQLERFALTIAFKKLREEAEAASRTDFDGEFFDLLPAQQKALIRPKLAAMRALLQDEITGFRANEANLTTRLAALDTLLGKLV